MTHNHESRTPRRQSFWKTRTGVAFITFITVAGLLLAYEHRVHIFTGEWLLAALLLVCIGMHLFMHGAHGGHGGGRKDSTDDGPGDDVR